jgi:protoheme IX farnesyltransferase
MQTATDISALHDGPLAARAASAHPSRLADYYELVKPRMNFLVLATTGVGYYMASHGGADWARLAHTLVGTGLTAAGAAVLNQQMERGHDANMRRTAGRPIPAGRVGPTEALLLGVALSIVGVMQLLLFVNPLTAALGAFTLGSYVFIYTPLKRVTTLCTIVGAVPGALPSVMGWTAVNGHLPSSDLWHIAPQALALFGILFFWQMPHFLAIAIMYRDDYARAGFKMLPVVDPDLRATGMQIVLWSLTLIPVSLLPAALLPATLRMAGGMYFASALIMGLVFAGFGIICAVRRARPEARQLFFASIVYLPFLTACMMIDKVA